MVARPPAKERDGPRVASSYYSTNSFLALTGEEEEHQTLARSLAARRAVAKRTVATILNDTSMYRSK
jgi:hypothetical protein